jgi:hypothetical protein
MSDTLYSDDSTPSASADKAKKSVDPKPAAKQETLLDRLAATVSEKVRRKDIYINVPERAGVTLKISPNITQSQVRKWRREAGEESKNGMDATKFATFVIGHTTEAILMNDQEVKSDSGYDLNFASEEVLAMTKTSRPVPDAVRAFFGLDPHVEAAALAILDAAGFGDTIEPNEDPTTRSSAN